MWTEPALTRLVVNQWLDSGSNASVYSDDNPPVRMRRPGDARVSNYYVIDKDQSGTLWGYVGVQDSVFMNPAQGIKPLTAKVIVAGGGWAKFFHVMVSDQLEPRIDPPMSLFEDDIIVRRSRSDHKTYYLDSVHLGLLRDYMSSDEGKEADYIEVSYKYIVQDVAIRNPLLKSRV